MKASTKAAMLSGLVFPGLGQLILKHTTRGLVYVGLSLAGVLVSVSMVIDMALQVLNELGDTGLLDINQVFITTHNIVHSGEHATLNYLLLALIGLWLVSIIDAWYLGREQDDAGTGQALEE